MKQKLLNLLQYAYEQEQAFIQNLSVEKRCLTGTPERWSAKDTIAHIAAWKRRGAQWLAALGRGEPSPGFDDLATFNAKTFAENQILTWEQVIEKSREAYQFLREQTETVSEGVLAAPETPEQGDEPVWWFVLGTGCTHALGHLTEYSIARGKVEIALEMQEEAAELLLQLNGPNWKVYYGLAVYYIAAGQLEKALDALGKAFGLRPSLVEQSKDDPRLISLREQPGYQTLFKG